MNFSSKLHRLIDTVAPYWAGEAAVFTSYWRWDGRTRATDLAWLKRQCYKEIWGSGLVEGEGGLFLGPVEQLRKAFPAIDIDIDRHEVLDIAEGLRAEFAHYCAFADAHDALLAAGEQKLNPRMLQWWKEDEALTALRQDHRTRFGEIGVRAARFTEGGYCTLFSEGMKLAERPTPGHESADSLIARACALVYDDEFGHMLKGIAGLDREGLAEADWQTLAALAVEQMKSRIGMRNAQFGYPLSGTRLDDARSGRCEPLPFDYERAKLAAA